MAFNVRDLTLTVSPESDRSWMIVIGCGSGSVMLHTNTQQKYVRYDAVDLMHGVKTIDDIGALRQELKACLQKLKALEGDLMRMAGIKPKPEGDDDSGDQEEDGLESGDNVGGADPNVKP